MSTEQEILAAMSKRRGLPTGSVSRTTKINRTGPQIEVLNPTFEALKENAKSIPDTQNALHAFNYIFDKADELIPATEDPQTSFLNGMQRSFGSSGLGRLVGAGDQGAIAFKKLREPYAPMLRTAVGDKGAASEGDMARILKGFPENSDTTLARQTSRKAGQDLLGERINIYNQMYNALKKKKRGSVNG